MPFTVLKGSFHVRNYSPDGDSVRFRPDDPQRLRGLSGFPAKINPQGHVQLRVEAIDALETHFSPRGGSGALHQPLALAHAAGDHLLGFLGITNVVWDDAHATVLQASDGVRGHILARTVEKNGRPVAFLYAGEPAETDGTAVFLDTNRLRRSYNYASLAAGLTYPTYYRSLFSDLRQALTEAAEAARVAGMGVYVMDRTTDGCDVSSLEDITRRHTILPKLFRRLSEYLVSMGTVEGFKRTLELAQEPVLDLRHTNFTHLDTFVEQEGNRIRLTRRPEELVFDEMPTLPPHRFAAVVAGEVEAVPVYDVF
jgi:hypothetical protein